ncbi:MAG: IS5 family transposase [Myxococcales bacterium]|nr:IS5 family transposase [Myxococcales bacterium]
MVAPLVEQVMRFLDAIAWILRSGAPWRDLAKDFGPWERIYRRYRRWALAGTWERLRRALSRTTAFRFLLIDSTIVKAHPHAAGALKRDGRQALGRSRGGFTTKLHAVVTERGELVRYIVTGGEVADITHDGSGKSAASRSGKSATSRKGDDA